MFRGWLVLQLAELCFICLTCLIMHDRGYSSLANDMMESRTERPNQEEVLPITKEMHYLVGEKVDASV